MTIVGFWYTIVFVNWSWQYVRKSDQSYFDSIRFGRKGCGNGFHITDDNCTDLNECSVGHSSCSAGFICKNNIGGFSCLCHDGFTAEGDECVDIRYRFHTSKLQ